MSLRNAALSVLLGVVLAGVLGYELGRERASVATKHPLERQELRKCPPSAWARGGGTDYAAAGMTCTQVNEFVLGSYRRATGDQGRALMFNGWVCFQRSTGGRYSPVLNVCADGKRKLRFLFH